MWLYIIIWSGIALLFNSFIIFANWFAVAPSGDESLLWLMLMWLPVAGVALVIAPFALLWLLSRSMRHLAFRVFLSCAIWIATFVACLHIGELVRMDGMRHFAIRSRPLVVALHSYERDHGRPASDLRDLVPKYLSGIPSTGFGAYPAYELVTGEGASRYEGNPWVLYVSTPSGGINFDSMLYFPRQNYPVVGFGGWLERVENWAYVHE